MLFVVVFATVVARIRESPGSAVRTCTYLSLKRWVVFFNFVMLRLVVVVCHHPFAISWFLSFVMLHLFFIVILSQLQFVHGRVRVRVFSRSPLTNNVGGA